LSFKISFGFRISDFGFPAKRARISREAGEDFPRSGRGFPAKRAFDLYKATNDSQDNSMLLKLVALGADGLDGS